MRRERLDMKLATFRSKIAKLETERNELIKTVQEACPHLEDRCLEGPSIVVCMDCGYSEETWQRSFDVAYRHDWPSISNVENYKIGPVFTRDDVFKMEYPERFIRKTPEGEDIPFDRWKEKKDINIITLKREGPIRKGKYR